MVFEEHGDLSLGAPSGCHLQDQISDGVLSGINGDVIHPKKGEGGRQRCSLIAVDKRMVLGDIEEIGRTHLVVILVEILAIERRLNGPQGRRQKAGVSNSSTPAVASDLIFV